MNNRMLLTSESVAAGHPDKVCDQIADAILDACLTEDRCARVAAEVLVTGNFLILAGEITTTAHADYEQIARETIREIGYTDPTLGFDADTCEILNKIQKQSPDIALGVDREGAGDQGIVFGYANTDTPEFMPLPIMLAHQLVFELQKLPQIGPDGKSQVTVEYDGKKPVRVDTVVLSGQHIADFDPTELLKETAYKLPFVDNSTKLLVNPTGRFVIGGPAADTGLTGRKTSVDTYGGQGRHGGGAFSGKDPSKVDRSASYAARHVAKSLVAAGLAEECEVQISYAIGVVEPVSIHVETFGTGTIDPQIIRDNFDLSPHGIIEKFDLLRPIYKETAFGGHFGRNFPWEDLTIGPTGNF